MTTTLRISEVADRSGFSPPTLRYYESIGLLPVPARSGNGYRVYDGRTLDRLAIIARAKQLGCSLDEIGEILAVGDAGHCAPVQARLSRLVAGKIADAEARIVELTALVADLRRAAAVLASSPPDGRCDESCGCLGAPTDGPARVGAVGTVAPVALVAGPSLTDGDADGEPPIACSLGAGDMDARMADWHDLLAGVTGRTAIDDGLRLTFGPDTPLDRIATLVAAEQTCCAFFRFALTVDHRGTALEVRAPADAQDVLIALFGSAHPEDGALRAEGQALAVGDQEGVLAADP